MNTDISRSGCRGEDSNLCSGGQHDPTVGDPLPDSDIYAWMDEHYGPLMACRVADLLAEKDHFAEYLRRSISREIRGVPS